MKGINYFRILLILFILGGKLTFAQDAYEYKTIKDIPYYDESQQVDEYIKSRCLLDVYYPVNKEKFATIIWIHGGGLYSYQKFLPEEFKNKGYGIVSINYRLSPKVKAPAYIEDAAAAVAWVFNNIESYGGDSSLVFVSGASAGGYLTMMVSLDKKWLAKYDIDANRIAGILSLGGETITHFTVRKEMGIPDTQPLINEYAPLTYVRADAPPLILTTGDREMEISGRYEENAYLARMMKNVGHKQTKLYEIQGYGHSNDYAAIPIILRAADQIVKAKNEVK